MDLGVPGDEVDPAWMQGVMEVKAGYSLARQADFESIGS